jgi:hypothetical protein
MSAESPPNQLPPLRHDEAFRRYWLARVISLLASVAAVLAATIVAWLSPLRAKAPAGTAQR